MKINTKKAVLSIPVSSLLGVELGTPATEANLGQGTDDVNGQSRFKPNPEDYVYANFRALSAVRIPRRGINFSKPGVLKAAMPMLLRQTVYRDHRVAVDNWAGVVVDALWDSTGGPAGENGPPGINVRLKIDGVQAPAVARGLLSDPPTLHSVSVGVEFEWEKSHPKMSDRDFWYNFGDEIDGKVVELIVTKITKFNEISVVWQGADPNAKRLSADGSDEGEFDMLKAELAKALGLDPESGDEVLLTELTKALNKPALVDNVQVEALTAQVADLEGQLATATEQLDKITPASEELVSQASLGAQYLNDQRTEAVRLFKLVEGEKAAENILTMLGGCNLETAKAYIDLYAPKAEAMFGAKCNKCGSQDLGRQHSHTQDPNPAAPSAQVVPGSLSKIHG